MKRYDVSAIGELLIDFTPSGVSENGNPLFERNPGGAPANVLAALSNFGKKTAFMGKIGKDMFGDFLKNVLTSHDIDTSGLCGTSEYNTTLAFVCLDENGDRSFSFYRNPGADLMMDVLEVDTDIIKDSKIFHFGSVSMTANPARAATLYAAEYAKKEGIIVSYDPNLRIPLWSDEQEAKKYILEGMKYADIVKISEEEAEFLFDIKDNSASAEKITKMFETKLVLITKGADGCYYKCGEYEGNMPALKVNVLDTTGAGDAFMAGVLNKLIDKGGRAEVLTKSELEECVKFGIATGSLSTEKKGAIPSMPSLDEVGKVMNHE